MEAQFRSGNQIIKVSSCIHQMLPKAKRLKLHLEAAASETKRLQEAASILRRAIQVAFAEAEEMPWPPSVDFVVSDNVRRPSCLEGFVECLLSVKSDSSENRQRLVTSFAKLLRMGSGRCRSICFSE